MLGVEIAEGIAKVGTEFFSLRGGSFPLKGGSFPFCRGAFFPSPSGAPAANPRSQCIAVTVRCLFSRSEAEEGFGRASGGHLLAARNAPASWQRRRGRTPHVFLMHACPDDRSGLDLCARWARRCASPASAAWISAASPPSSSTTSRRAPFSHACPLTCPHHCSAPGLCFPPSELCSAKWPTSAQHALFAHDAAWRVCALSAGCSWLGSGQGAGYTAWSDEALWWGVRRWTRRSGASRWR